MAWVVLTGYMGAGKTSVGRAVAARMGRHFVDSDARIEADAELAIPTIFSTKGELWFRRTEERTIREIISDDADGVLAVGGGALESSRTRDFLTRSAQVVWLQVDPERLWERVSGSSRPLATDHDRFLRRYARRAGAYASAAHVVVDADRPLDEVAEAVIHGVSERFAGGAR
jgi:shikimate kinase